MSRRKKREHKRFIHTPDNRIIERDPTEHEQWLAIHGRTEGGAYIVSTDGERAHAVTVPIALLSLSEEHYGFVTSTNMWKSPPQLERAPVHWASGPGFIFDEKGLR